MKWKNIIKNAEKIKKGIETENRLPAIEGYNYAELIYVFCKAVQSPNNPQAYKKVAVAPNPTGNAIKNNLTKKEYITLTKNVVKFIDERDKCPNYVTYQKFHIRPRLLLYCLSKILVFYHEHNDTYPITCWFKSTDVEGNGTKDNKTTTNTDTSTSDCTNPYKATPYNDDTGCNAMGQDTSYYCADSMLQKMFYRLGYRISQEELAEVAGTTYEGTGHDGIETAIAYCGRKWGVKFDVKWYNFSDLGWEGMGKLMCRKNTSVGNHVLYRDMYGHYEYPLTVNTSDDSVKVINSLGSYCGSCYCGYIEERYLSTHQRYMGGISQKSVLVITKV